MKRNYINYFHYTDGIGVIRIASTRRPKLTTIPKCGSWVVKELNNGEWKMPPFPEITWKTLQRLEYLGKTTKALDR